MRISNYRPPIDCGEARGVPVALERTITHAVLAAGATLELLNYPTEYEEQNVRVEISTEGGTVLVPILVGDLTVHVFRKIRNPGQCLIDYQRTQGQIWITSAEFKAQTALGNRVQVAEIVPGMSGLVLVNNFDRDLYRINIYTRLDLPQRVITDD